MTRDDPATPPRDEPDNDDFDGADDASVSDQQGEVGPPGADDQESGDSD